jgi:DNA processing protein
MAEATGPTANATGSTAWPQGFISGLEDREALTVLLGLASLTPRRLLQLAGRRGPARSCLRAVRAGRAGSEADQALARELDGAGLLAKVTAAGARLVAATDHEYPSRLLDLFDPPAGLFVRGDGLDRLEPRVAIVGARNCSGPGAEIASMLGGALARAGVCVVSGGALGIDAAAHRGAIEAGGATLAVMGCGIDRTYPRQNRRLLGRVADCGALVSEYPPGVTAMPFRFPARNRIIAALSRAVVVVEGATGSGSMITADHALDIGREVLAVPGPITGPLSAVPHALIREGATLIRGPEDLLTDLGLEPMAAAPNGSGDTPALWTAGMDAAERKVWDALTVSSPPDRLASLTGLSVPEVVSALVGLEMRRLVMQTGGRYERRPLRKGSS